MMLGKNGFRVLSRPERPGWMQAAMNKSQVPGSFPGISNVCQMKKEDEMECRLGSWPTTPSLARHLNNKMLSSQRHD
jgi:hypothetical protein